MKLFLDKRLITYGLIAGWFLGAGISRIAELRNKETWTEAVSETPASEVINASA